MNTCINSHTPARTTTCAREFKYQLPDGKEILPLTSVLLRQNVSSHAQANEHKTLTQKRQHSTHTHIHAEEAREFRYQLPDAKELSLLNEHTVGPECYKTHKHANTKNRINTAHKHQWQHSAYMHIHPENSNINELIERISIINENTECYADMFLSNNNARAHTCINFWHPLSFFFSSALFTVAYQSRVCPNIRACT